MIDIIQGIGDFFASIGSWVTNTVQQAQQLWQQLMEWVDRIQEIVQSINVIITSILPGEIVAIIISAIILILIICVWEIVN